MQRVDRCGIVECVSARDRPMGDWLQAKGDERTKRIALVGSAPDAPDINIALKPDNIVVAINNSWRALERFDFIVYTDEFDAANKPPCPDLIRKGLNTGHYVDAASRFGNHFWCGHTMSFMAGYLCLSIWPYSQLNMFAVDMIYQGSQTHFYGKGEPDPVRRHITLQNLRGKSMRLFYHAYKRDSLVLNLSRQPHSNLAVPRVTAAAGLGHNLVDYVFWRLSAETKAAVAAKGEVALEMERSAPFDLQEPNWPFLDDPSAWEYVAKVDAAWERLAEHVPEIEMAVGEYMASVG